MTGLPVTPTGRTLTHRALTDLFTARRWTRETVGTWSLEEDDSGALDRYRESVTLVFDHLWTPKFYDEPRSTRPLRLPDTPVDTGYGVKFSTVTGQTRFSPVCVCECRCVCLCWRNCVRVWMCV